MRNVGKFSSFVAVTLFALIATAAHAQQRPAAIVEAGAGYAAFVESPPIDHTTIGGSARFYVTDRIAIGPEVSYMRGPGEDRDWFFTGNATIDLLAPASSPRPLTPYLIAGGGYTRMTQAVGTGLFTSGEGSFTAGGGVRLSPNGRWFVAPELRLGWELHWRVNAVVGVRLP